MALTYERIPYFLVRLNDEMPRYLGVSYTRSLPAEVQTQLEILHPSRVPEPTWPILVLEAGGDELEVLTEPEWSDPDVSYYAEYDVIVDTKGHCWRAHAPSLDVEPSLLRTEAALDRAAWLSVFSRDRRELELPPGDPPDPAEIIRMIEALSDG